MSQPTTLVMRIMSLVLLLSLSLTLADDPAVPRRLKHERPQSLELVQTCEDGFGLERSTSDSLYNSYGSDELYGESVPRGITVCAKCARGEITCQGICVDPNSALHCGTCDTPCGGLCIAGQCQCFAGRSCWDPLDLTRYGWCNNATKACQSCPVGTLNCDSTGDLGAESDCLSGATDANNCGSCGLKCNAAPGALSRVTELTPPSFGNVCVAGECRCGSRIGSCPATAPFCNFATQECTECQVGSLICSPTSPGVRSRFCNILGNTCTLCEIGLGDCIAAGNTGDGTDCETDLLVTGQTNHCGACGAKCKGGHGQSCCSGDCRCGSFVLPNDPTIEECEAGAICSEDEYCQADIGQCVKMGQDVLTSGALLQSCTRSSNGSAVFEFGTLKDVSLLPFCGSCNKSLAANSMYVNGKCTFGDSAACGPRLVNCSLTGQACEAGVCVGKATVAQILSWEGEFQAQDPDFGQTVEGPGHGCASWLVLDQQTVMRNYLHGQISSLVECANRAPSLTASKVLSFAGFANPLQRLEWCPGRSGTEVSNACHYDFCNDLYANVTSSKAEFCRIMTESSAQQRACAYAYRTSKFPNGGDISLWGRIAKRCAVPTVDFSLSAVDIATFLGCPEVASLQSLWKFKLNSVPEAYIYRVEGCRLYLGGASGGLVKSWFVGFVVGMVGVMMMVGV